MNQLHQTMSRYARHAIPYATALSIAAAIGLGCWAQQPAQTPPRPARPVQPAQAPPVNLPVVGPRLPGTQYTVQSYIPQAALNEQQQKLAKFVEVLRSEDTDASDKEAARDEMHELLGASFDQDIERRHQQVESLEKQISDLRAQIKKRQAAKERLVELRIEMMVNEAEGLGFPASWSTSNSYYYRYAPTTATFTPAVPSPQTPLQPKPSSR